MSESEMIEEVWLMFLLAGHSVDDYDTFVAGYKQYLIDKDNTNG